MKRFMDLFGFNKSNREQETTLPISALVARGWNRVPLGWDHTNMKWYYPIWPELDSSRMKLRLDWGDGHDSDKSVD
jgi:hypothetical protein